MITSLCPRLMAVAVLATIAGGGRGLAADGGGTADFGALVLGPGEAARLTVVNVTETTACAARLRMFVIPGSMSGNLGPGGSRNVQERNITLGPGDFATLVLSSQATGARVFRAVADGLAPVAEGEDTEARCRATLQIRQGAQTRAVVVR
jgi:hypothetical protein